MMKALEALSPSTIRRSGMVTLSASFWLSIPYGPSAKVSQTISGPSVNISGFRASVRPAVTIAFEFGLITVMRGRDMGATCVFCVDETSEAITMPATIQGCARLGHALSAGAHHALRHP